MSSTCTEFCGVCDFYRYKDLADRALCYHRLDIDIDVIRGNHLGDILMTSEFEIWVSTRRERDELFR
jgi:hypothetical protein